MIRNLLCIPFISFACYVVPRHPEYKLIPAAFIFLPTILCNNYCTGYVYSDNMYDNDKIVFSMMPNNMCFVSKCINSTERMMVILPNMCELFKIYLRRCLKIFNILFLQSIINYCTLKIICEYKFYQKRVLIVVQ